MVYHYTIRPGVYIIKKKGANTISKRLAELVNSYNFPDWDKNEREYLRITYLLEELPLLNIKQFKITEDNFQQSELRDYLTSE
ncbi:hypothetical protein GcC1_073023 [Golovinomyces cichoracearum]|uniref:Uncharacterized protein n=1 Tax=Golovinomyces cichoracearum TaxID=62708 RepID=A0A420IP52_9PEZI|nr:hypothetical protein GcC1_073023 [Golovinomyces cichoracearum]